MHATSDPAAFERVVAEAFSQLGFASRWVGGAGRTDVEIVADLGPGEGYRVIIDCKTTTHEAVSDAQIDWVTLVEHRRHHQADYVAVVGCMFSSSRVVSTSC